MSNLFTRILHCFQGKRTKQLLAENLSLRRSIEKLTERENQLQTLNVNFKRDFEFELKKVKEKYANKFRDLEIQKIKETRELNVQIQDLKIELARASELNARYRQKLISTQSEVKELKQIIANLESDKQRNTPGFLTDGKQLAKLKKMLQQTELDYEFKLRELEQKNELIDTLTRQLFDLQKANPS